jgi:predicted adenine nucleotide alpha hydrolase (AANH) superfamily ATPase
MCFDMRLERTALYAHEHGFDSFTTTNATSRWKDEKQVNDSGLKAAAKYEGVEYWVSDWQTAEMTQRKYDVEGSRARRASPIATDGLAGRPTDDL